MQRIDSKSLDLLFNNQAQDNRQSFLDVNKEMVSELKKMGKGIANRIQDQTIFQSPQARPVVKESFERTIKEKETDTDNKTDKKKLTKKKDEELVQINIASTQILDDAEMKLGLGETKTQTDLSCKQGFCVTEVKLNKINELDPNFIGPPVSTEVNQELNLIGPPAPITAETPATAINAYEEDISDIELNLLPFSNLTQEVQNLNKAAERIPVELKLGVLTEMTEKLTTEIEDLTKSIANIDLNTESGVEKILELSNQIEELVDINNALKTQVEELKLAENITKEMTAKLDPEAKTLIDSKLEKFIESYKELKASSTEADLKPEVLNKTTEAQIQKETEYRSNINQTLGFKDRIEVLEFTQTQEKLDLVKEAKASANESANLLADIKSSGKFTDSNSNPGSGQKSQQNIIQGLQQATGVSRAMSTRSEVIGKPVQMERLPNFIAEKATQVPSGVKQELTIFLNPENMGEIELSISKEGNKLDIKLMFSNEEAMKRVEQKLTELRVLLKSRGFESKIELNQTNTDSSANTQNQQNTNNGQSAFNQAREEQKERFLDRPNWLDEDISSDEPSFEDTYEGIMN